MDKLDWLFWISLVILIGGVIAFMYGSVEVINHKSDDGGHKAAYWGGFVAEILGLIGIVIYVVAKGRKKYQSTNYYKNKMAVANERERLYGLGKSYESDQKAAADKAALDAKVNALAAKQLAQQKLAAYDPNNPFNSL